MRWTAVGGSRLHGLAERRLPARYDASAPVPVFQSAGAFAGCDMLRCPPISVASICGRLLWPRSGIAERARLSHFASFEILM